MEAIIIEDSGESFSAVYKDVYILCFWKYICISFKGNKVCISSDGEMLLVNRLEVEYRVY